MKKYLVVFEKQAGELVNAYSLVDDEILMMIPAAIIESFNEVDDRLYTTEELEEMRDTLI